MSWSHDHYPKAHWCGAQTRNPDVNRCPKSLWCFGLLKAWVSDFDPANSSLPYVHSELISDISVNDPYLNPYLIWWSPIFDPIILNPYLTFLVICWWYVPNDIHFISLFFSPKFCTATATATQLWSPRLSQQFHTSALTPSYDHQTQGHQCRVQVDSTPAPKGISSYKKRHETHETLQF